MNMLIILVDKSTYREENSEIKIAANVKEEKAKHKIRVGHTLT